MPNKPIVIAAFYHFASLPDYEEMRLPLLEFCKAQGLKGSILLAREGVNSTISGTREAVDALFARLKSDPRLGSLEHKESYSDTQPFGRMKVRLKKEIVHMGVEGLDVERRGEYVSAAQWDRLISDPDVVVVDTRNDYEVKIGTFARAVNPKTRFFREFPAWAKEHLDPQKHKKIAMFCTGGIRCEKSTALLKNMGFEDVYHLKGGILQYLEDTHNENGSWQGDCFVFDDRVAVDSALQPSGATICPSCNEPYTTDELKLGNDTYGGECACCLQKRGEKVVRFQDVHCPQGTGVFPLPVGEG